MDYSNKILPLPSHVTVEETTKGISLSYRWYKPLVWFLIIFAIFWNGFMVGWMLAPTPWFFKAFGLLHVSVGIGLTWYIIGLFVNTTKIEITKYEIAVTHTPLPMPFYYKNKRLDKQDVKQIYIKEKLTTNKNSRSVSYELYTLNEQTKSQELMTLESAELAYYIKRKVEYFFNIAPQAIAGEYLQ
jgi:hypothetical protein